MNIRVTMTLLAALATTTAGIPSAGAAAAAPRPLPEPGLQAHVDEILSAYRKTIVLLADEESLDEMTHPRALMAGWLLAQAREEALARLSEELTAELDWAIGQKRSAIRTEQFFSWLESDPGLHDADKLAFADLAEDLADVIRKARPGPIRTMWLGRIEDDTRALSEIRARYDREMEKIFGTLRTRGMTVRREAWDAYVKFVRELYQRETILEEREEEVSAALGTTRGGRPKRPAPGRVIDGTRLPPKTLVLTFDDGPHFRYTDKIREILDKYSVKGLFFELGKNVGTVGTTGVKETRSAEVSRRLRDSGHQIGNHTYSHLLLPKQTAAKVKLELEEADQTIEKALQAKPTFFRPPYGAFNDRIYATLAERGQKPFLWNIDSLDWSDPVPKSVAQRVLEQVEREKRGVILLHDIHRQSVEALPLIIEALQKKGYKFVAWNEQPAATEVADNVAAEVPLYRESHAVIVGINEYEKWPRLAYAVNDAQAVRDLLVRKYAFKPENIAMLLDGDATRGRILSVLGDALANTDKVKRDDRVFFFFAGHGTTRLLPSGKSLGYIVPVEADTNSYQSQAISMTNFQDISEAIPAKHILFVMDACYSGLALTRGGPPGDATNYLKEITRRTARQMFTAGGANEQVADNGPNGHSIFTWTLLQGLDGRADLSGDQIITASELAAYVSPAVSSLSHQTPAFGSLVGSEGGEYVFSLSRDGELLSDVSTQLDQDAIALNAEIEKVRKLISEKEVRNQETARKLAAEKQKLASLQEPSTPALPSPREQARRHSDEGMRLYREKKYREALAEFEAAVRLDPADVQSVNNAGFVTYKLGEYDQSFQWLKQALVLDPKRAVAYLNLGDTCEKLRKTGEAVAAWEKYLQLLPNSPVAAKVREKIARNR